MRILICMAVFLLTCFARAEDVPTLVQQLGSSGFKQRIAAEKALREKSVEVLPELRALMETEDVEIRNRLRGIIEYIVDHGPDGLMTLEETIFNPNAMAQDRTKAIGDLCNKMAEGREDALGLLSRIVADSKLGFDGAQGGAARSQVIQAVQNSFTALSERALNEPAIERRLLAVTADKVLRNYALRAMGHTAARGGKLSIEVLTEPGKHGLSLAMTSFACTPALLVGQKGMYTGMLQAAETADENELFQIGLTMQNGGVRYGALALPVLVRILERSKTVTPSMRAIIVLDAIAKQADAPEEVAAVLTEWRPKVEQMQGASVPRRAQATIRVVP